jgi:hypothetical protein
VRQHDEVPATVVDVCNGPRRTDTFDGVHHTHVDTDTPCVCAHTCRWRHTRVRKQPRRAARALSITHTRRYRDVVVVALDDHQQLRGDVGDDKRGVSAVSAVLKRHVRVAGVDALQPHPQRHRASGRGKRRQSPRCIARGRK